MKIENYTDMLTINYSANGSGTAHEQLLKEYAKKYDKCNIKESDLQALVDDLEAKSSEMMEEHPRWKKSSILLSTNRVGSLCNLYGWISINGNSLYVIHHVPAILKKD